MDNNAYLVTCENTQKTLLVDAANDADVLLSAIADNAPDGLELIVTTHRHFDHVQALKKIAGQTGALTAAHPLDAPELPVAPDRLLEDGDVIELGDLKIGIIHLQGHTPGSVTLVIEDNAGVTHLLTGDSLFHGGPGRTILQDDFSSLMNDLEEKIFARFPDDTVVYPGHGRETTLGVERPHLGEWRARGW
ncbi:MAG: MBL fold metallo-hydrolase [Nocardiaceae bacterium]|nr:MBL fold metallo-hydrolase [Nocardiaceae bacterium]